MDLLAAALAAETADYEKIYARAAAMETRTAALLATLGTLGAGVGVGGFAILSLDQGLATTLAGLLRNDLIRGSAIMGAVFYLFAFLCLAMSQYNRSSIPLVHWVEGDGIDPRSVELRRRADRGELRLRGRPSDVDALERVVRLMAKAAQAESTADFQVRRLEALRAAYIQTGQRIAERLRWQIAGHAFLVFTLMTLFVLTAAIVAEAPPPA